MRILDAALQAAQDGAVHRPIIELTSHNPVASIPFTGYKISEQSAETGPKLIMHSSGRLVYVYIYNGKPYMGYSDVDRTEWTHGIALNTDPGYTCVAITCCEMANGNIGIMVVLNFNAGTAQYVQSMVYSPTGTYVSGRNTAFSWTTNEYCGQITLAFDGTTYRWVMGAQNTAPDPDEYCLRTGTSADMVNWNTATTFVPFGLSNLRPFSNPYLFFPANDDPVLVFDYVDSYNVSGDPIINLYLSTSLDGGATWQAPTKLTNYSTYSAIGYQPALAQSVEDSMLLTWTERSPTLYMSRDVAGWNPDDGEGFVWSLGWDPVNRKIYYCAEESKPGVHVQRGVTEVDVDAWEPTNYWSPSSSPVLPDSGDTFGKGNKNSVFYDGKFYVMRHWDHIAAIDPEANTITDYYFSGASQNVTWDSSGYVLKGFGIDQVNGHMYCTMVDGGTYDFTLKYLRIDLAQTGPTFVATELGPNYYGLGFWSVGNGSVSDRYFIDEGFIVTWCGTEPGQIMQLGLFAVSGDTVSKHKIYGDTLNDGADLTWASVNITMDHVMDVYLEGSYLYILDKSANGLYKLDIVNDIATLITCPLSGFTSEPKVYSLMEYSADLRALMITGLDGLWVYYLDDESWAAYTAETIDGITPNREDFFGRCYYDPVNDGFLVGCQDTYFDQNNDGGILFIPRNGVINQVQYADLTDTGSWEMGAAAQLITDFSAYDTTAAYVPESAEFYAMWVDETPSSGHQELTWDKNESVYDLTPHIVGDEEVSWHRNVVGEPCELQFSLAPHYLFDEFNLTSLLRKYTVKGRRIQLRAGEEVSGVDYLENQGSYYVATRQINYTREDRPVIKVSALDRLGFLQALEIDATAFKSQVMASTVFSDFAVAHGAIDSMDDLADTPFYGDEAIDAQFVDMTLYEALYTLAWRYGCMVRFDMDNKLDCVRLPNTDIDHAYLDGSTLFRIRPDDSYSDITNRVIVTGVHPDPLQVVHSEEMVAQLSGTSGWWGDPETYTVYYSEDHQKVVLNPRLKVISSVESIPFQLAGGVSEKISYEDPDNRYCKVHVDAPNLIPALAAAIGGYFAAGKIGDETTAPGAPTIPLGRLLENVAVIMAFQILGSIATWQYEIWGQPVGSVSRTIQGSADDTENIAFIGKVFAKTLEGWNCNSTLDCDRVAERELDIVKMQRRRVNIEKVAHLQDEEGDTISFRHPVSGQVLAANIVKLTRSWKKGKGGYFKDVINGWVL